MPSCKKSFLPFFKQQKFEAVTKWKYISWADCNRFLSHALIIITVTMGMRYHYCICKQLFTQKNRWNFFTRKRKTYPRDGKMANLSFPDMFKLFDYFAILSEWKLCPGLYICNSSLWSQEKVSWHYWKFAFSSNAIRSKKRRHINWRCLSI